MKEISFTYPDIYYSYYKEKRIKEEIAASYSEIKEALSKAYTLCKKYNINVQVVDIPYCQLPENVDIKDTDDYHYQERTKIHYS